MAGNKKHGYLRGNANGRNGSSHVNNWFCNGCQKTHTGKTFRNKMLDGFDYCDKEYFMRV